MPLLPWARRKVANPGCPVGPLALRQRRANCRLVSMNVNGVSDEEKCGSPGCTNQGLPLNCTDDFLNCIWSYQICNFCFATTSKSSKLIIARLTGTKVQ